MSSQKPIFWKNGSILHSEQLNKCFQESDRASWDLLRESDKLNYGFIDFEIDNQVLSDGILKIKTLKCVSPVGVLYIKNDNEEIIYDLRNKSENLTDLVRFFIIFEDDKEITEETTNEIGDIIPIVRKSTKITITDKELLNSIPICEISIDNGNFVLGSFQGPYVSIKENNALYQDITNLIFNLKQKTFTLKDLIVVHNKIEDRFLLHSIFQAVGILNSLIFCYFGSIDLYKNLIQCFYILSIQSHTFPYVEKYDHNNSYAMNKSLLQKCYSVISGLQIEDQNFHMKKDGIFLYCNIGVVDKLVLIIEPDNNQIRNWIINTPIFSESHKLNVLTKRVKGMERKIVDSMSNTLVVELQIDDFFSFNEKLYIYNSEEIECKRIVINFQ